MADVELNTTAQDETEVNTPEPVDQSAFDKAAALMDEVTPDAIEEGVNNLQAKKAASTSNVVDEKKDTSKKDDTSTPEEDKETVSKIGRQLETLVHERRKIAEKEKSLGKQENTLKQSQQLLEDLKSGKGLQSLAKSLNVTPQQVLQQFSQEAKLNPNDPATLVLNKIKQLEDQVKSQAQKVEEAERENREIKIQQDLAAYISSDANKVKYEYLNIFGQEGVEAVFETIALAHEKTGKIMDEDEACALVEKAYEKEANKFASAKKFTGVKKPEEKSTPKVVEKKKELPQTKKPTTITNKQSSENGRPKAWKSSQKEAFDRAIGLMKELDE
jgi:hypothetical protein